MSHEIIKQGTRRETGCTVYIIVPCGKGWKQQPLRTTGKSWRLRFTFCPLGEDTWLWWMGTRRQSQTPHTWKTESSPELPHCSLGKPPSTQMAQELRVPSGVWQCCCSPSSPPCHLEAGGPSCGPHVGVPVLTLRMKLLCSGALC